MCPHSCSLFGYRVRNQTALRMTFNAGVRVERKSYRSEDALNTAVKTRVCELVRKESSSCWETKRFYDSSRPWTLVRHYYKGQMIKGWAGPEGGVKDLPAEEWHPYSPYSFITPPFPGYTSGHATVSGACSKALELFTGTDEYNFIERRRHCELTEEEPGELVDLDLPTWSATAEMAAVSRMLGGYHISTDNNVGLQMGRAIADYSQAIAIDPTESDYLNSRAAAYEYKKDMARAMADCWVAFAAEGAPRCALPLR